MQQPIYINALASVSVLGTHATSIWESYQKQVPFFSNEVINGTKVPVASLPKEIEDQLKTIKEVPQYKHLDRSVLLGLLAARNLKKEITLYQEVGLAMGSSRGATELLEHYHEQFLVKNKVPVRTSPTTTLGNLGAWVGQELGASGPYIEHSVTCSSGLFGVLSGIAWLQSNMAQTFIAGASEASITPFTLAQMQALKLYSKLNTSYACESLLLDKAENTMVLGEAASLVVLSKENTGNSRAMIVGVGTATETITHGSSISKEGTALQHAMQKALHSANLKTVDAIVMHAPGTIKGDLAEYNAVKNVFPESQPLLTSNKWLLGHTLGASGLMSLEMALLMLEHNYFLENKFFNNNRKLNTPLTHILINTIGFGGNAVSIIVSKPK